ncbi:tRNA A64-2'-O-ribosylphosphate transferase [Fulvia fulva]|uniref:tRNA A64-2'-O-ribosylphosphate transferase n=1 Tax=Passalora fulva TaxID=5499 RepID=A0A9Q8UQR1_PASFU|nr:tRNA A64-2'-O-ribosylphosphate transferase [Fulvia fulva]KAK4622866.1 tRNA A64-2'-O-ribosylphosphate transferase [Fulvia fulva]UJO19029.1 tRNA A64-2'-O-ribosylphosphate transferase [Fulvia fulva]WPV16442.1 tRNA A64-2'-O-ribosylphosphate transferase [Fulvia fulva]WPV30843.1 tRNA A64-2'-O-ribosylphosphate transferase [Fulvia fulva]
MSPAPALHESELIFSSAASALKDALGELKRSNLSIKNRLKSIKQDSDFVSKVASAYGLPLVANERCGSWYIRPDLKAGSAYFKSTDGHFGQWGFSLRRLNLQVLDVVHDHGGCIIVDSTRRGKSMPDALSKTIPIWSTILNRLLFPDDASSHKLRTPLDVLSESEHAQIEGRLKTCEQDVGTLGLNLDELREKLHSKPLQVTWQRPDDALPTRSTQRQDNLIVLCTASNQTSNETSATSDYVQGAADDPESWSHGLDAAMFWKHSDKLLSATEDELPIVIAALVEDARSNKIRRASTLVKPTTSIYTSNNDEAEAAFAEYDVIISCVTKTSDVLSEKLKGRYVPLICSTGKVGSRQLRFQLPKLSAVNHNLEPTSKILVTCDTGKDLAIGTALALLCTSFTEGGALRQLPDIDTSINKTVIKQRLSWIMVSMPDASPSRATLQSVNAFLMG